MVRSWQVGGPAEDTHEWLGVGWQVRGLADLAPGTLSPGQPHQLLSILGGEELAVRQGT